MERGLLAMTAGMALLGIMSEGNWVVTPLCFLGVKLVESWDGKLAMGTLSLWNCHRGRGAVAYRDLDDVGLVFVL